MENSSSKMLPTPIDRKVTPALHQKFLQTDKIKEFAFITHSKAHMEKWKHYITQPQVAPFSTADEYYV